MNFRIGNGYDIHAFAPDRKLILGGVEIPHELGLLGHSDADVLLHSISDALLGALSLGDIGKHFPDTDPLYKNADSLDLLKKVSALVHDREFEVGNIDATIIAESPKMQPYIMEMRENIADALSCDKEKISVKATTHEKLGALGRSEGIAVLSIALLFRR